MPDDQSKMIHELLDIAVDWMRAAHATVRTARSELVEASSPFAADLDETQLAARSGPSLAAVSNAEVCVARMSDPSWAPIGDTMRTRDVQWIAAFPIMIRASCAGVLSVYGSHDEPVEDAAIRSGSAIARQLAAWISNDVSLDQRIDAHGSSAQGRL